MTRVFNNTINWRDTTHFDSEDERAFEKYKPRGLFLEFYGSVFGRLTKFLLTVGQILANSNKFCRGYTAFYFYFLKDEITLWNKLLSGESAR